MYFPRLVNLKSEDSSSYPPVQLSDDGIVNHWVLQRGRNWGIPGEEVKGVSGNTALEEIIIRSGGSFQLVPSFESFIPGKGD